MFGCGLLTLRSAVGDTHTKTMRIPYYMAIQNGGGVVEGASLFFSQCNDLSSHS